MCVVAGKALELESRKLRAACRKVPPLSSGTLVLLTPEFWEMSSRGMSNEILYYKVLCEKQI